MMLLGVTPVNPFHSNVTFNECVLFDTIPLFLFVEVSFL